jgi:ribosomal protein S1
MVPESNEITPTDGSPKGDIPPPEVPASGPPERAEDASTAGPAGAGRQASVPETDAPGGAADDAGAGVAADGGVEGSDDHTGDAAFTPGDEPKDEAKEDKGDAKGGEKKRRRRRRGKKGAGAAAKPEGAAEGQPNAEAAAPTEASEGGERPTKGRRPEAAGKNAKRKRRAPRPEGAAPHRERAAFHVGEEVFGRVTSVTADAVMVDLSGKALAIFDRHELATDDLVPEVGDRFVAHVHGDGTRGGLVVLTRKPLREEETKPLLEAASESGSAVMGLVTGTVKGGLEVDVDGVRAFAPASHVDLHPGSDLAHLIGRRLEFTIAQYAKRGRDVVVSRKTYLEAEAREQRKTALSKLEMGSVVKGIVKSVVPYGAFVAIPSAEDVEGLVHMTEASHDRGAKLTDVFPVGSEIDVKVLRVDDKGKLWLSHKATIADPWEAATKTFAQGTRHKGKVLRLQPFGAFIELAPGFEGLLHTADLSFKRIEHPKDLLKEGDDIDVVVADVDRSSRKIALHAAPPAGEENEPRQRVAPHKSVKVAVVAAEQAGLIVRVIGTTGRQARGFIPAGQTGTERGTDLRKHFPAGMRLDAKVIEIDPRRGEAKLSLRAFKEDTEKAAYNEYRASVAKASKFGTLGDLLAKKTGRS